MDAPGSERGSTSRCPTGPSRSRSSTPCSSTRKENASMADAHPQLQGALDELAAAPRSIPAAALARLPGTAAFIFRGREAAIERMGAAFGVALPREACRFAAPGGRTAFWLGPDEWLLDAGNEAP